MYPIFKRTSPVGRIIDKRLPLKDIQAMLYNIDKPQVSDVYTEVKKYLPSDQYMTSNLNYRSTLSDEAKEYIFQYVGNGFIVINDTLRIIKRYDQRSFTLQQSILSAPKTEKPYIVTRATNDTSYIGNDVWTSWGFLSCSLNWNGTVSACNQGRRVLMMIEVPTGTPALYVEGVGDEYEMLFASETKLKTLWRGTRNFYDTETEEYVDLETIMLIIVT